MHGAPLYNVCNNHPIRIQDQDSPLSVVAYGCVKSSTITWCQNAGFSENKSMMEARLKPPEYLSLHSNVAENWRRLYQRFELYMLAIEADSKPNRTKIAILLSAIGPDALERYNHFKWDESPNDPPNSPPVPNDDNQQDNAQPAQSNAAQVNDNRNVLRSDVYADVSNDLNLNLSSYPRDIDFGFMRRQRNSTLTTTPRNYWLPMRANLKSTKT